MHGIENVRYLTADELRAQGVIPSYDPPPGPTRHPVVTESDVTWFMWTYFIGVFIIGFAIGTAVMMVMR